MKNFQLLRYLKKWMPLIVVFFLVMTVLSYQLLRSRQQYTAAAVIQYSASMTDISTLDVTEIYSSANMARVMDNLGLSSGTYSLDQLCASIQVEQVEQPEPTATEKPEETDGEEQANEEESPIYIVRCTLDSGASEEIVRDILNELLDVYFSSYSSEHINLEQVDNQTKDLIDTDYDYLEMVEIIDQHLTSTVSALNARYLRSWDFRSADTGCSFADLRNEFSFLQDVYVAQLYAQVLGNQITKDRQVLLDKYQNRIAEQELRNRQAQSETDDVLRVIQAYVDKMRQSGNTDIDYNYILGEVYGDRWDSGSLVDRTGEYDKLLGSWVDDQNNLDFSVIETAYCQYVIGVYRDGIMALDTAGIPVDSGLGDAMPLFSEASSGRASEQEVEEEIRVLLNRMNELYSIADRTNIEYNEYLGAQAIQILSTTSAGSTVRMKLYMAVVSVFFLVVGCCGAVLLGRIEDILEYLFLRDRVTGCMNRVSCDNFIHGWERRLLSMEMCCLNIQITNQRELNSQYGREEVDRGMRELGRTLRELFERRKNGFVGYNGSGQFWVFYEKEPTETVEYEVEYLSVVLAQALGGLSVAYQVGAANAGEQYLFHLRGLISYALKNHRSYSTGAPEGKPEEVPV